MKQAVLLCYNLKPEKAQKIRLAAMRLKIRVRPIAREEYGQTLAALCGLEELTDAELSAIDSRISRAMLGDVSITACVNARGSYGGTAPQEVRRQIEKERAWLEALA